MEQEEGTIFKRSNNWEEQEPKSMDMELFYFFLLFFTLNL